MGERTEGVLVLGELNETPGGLFFLRLGKIRSLAHLPQSIKRIAEKVKYLL